MRRFLCFKPGVRALLTPLALLAALTTTDAMSHPAHDMVRIALILPP